MLLLWTRRISHIACPCTASMATISSRGDTVSRPVPKAGDVIDHDSAGVNSSSSGAIVSLFG